MNEQQKQQAAKKTSIGGQAVIEGIYMKGPSKEALAVRTPSGEIDVEVWERKHAHAWYAKIPILRGIIGFVSTLGVGYKTLMRSADKAGYSELEEESKFDRWLSRTLGEKASNVIMGIAMILGVILAFLLFIYLPMWVVKALENVVPLYGWKTLLEGLIKIGIFICYLALCSRVKDVHRVFEYHGAEHKSIACYEAGEELTVENVRKYRRFHPRCGTSFLLIILIVSVLVTSFVTWDTLWMRVLVKLVCLPVTVGISYEIIKLAGRYDNIVTRIVSAPGLWLQRLTTQEPDDSMIEVALSALRPVLPETGEDDRW